MQTFDSDLLTELCTTLKAICKNKSLLLYSGHIFGKLKSAKPKIVDEVTADVIICPSCSEFSEDNNENWG